MTRSRGPKARGDHDAIGLARLWQNQGRKTEARELLAGMLGWFSEDIDTPDLVDAMALLEELS